MKTMLRVLIILFALIFGAYPISSSHASGGGGEEMPKLHWHFDGITGTYDRAALQRGYKVYREICSSCHSMDMVYFRNLSALGYSEKEIKAIASEYTVEDGPNDEGEMYERPALPSDHLISPFPNKKAAAYANMGAYPPDFSVLVKARHGGPDYIYAILTGYDDAPHDMELMPGQYWNRYTAKIIAMGPPLMDGFVSYEDGSPETLHQYSKDISEFLTWASDPHMEVRKRTGIKAFIFLFAFAVLMYAVKRKVWADVH